MKIATWNVNSIKVRLEHLIKWMDLARIDAVVLQETKTVDELFPLAELQAAGFDAVFLGQKTYNGVALVTRKSTIRSVSDVVYNIPGYPDEQKRMIAADIEHVSGTKLRFAGVYVPNGTELGSNRYLYKLDWMSALTTWVREQLAIQDASGTCGRLQRSADRRRRLGPRSLEGESVGLTS